MGPTKLLRSILYHSCTSTGTALWDNETTCTSPTIACLIRCPLPHKWCPALPFSRLHQYRISRNLCCSSLPPSSLSSQALLTPIYALYAVIGPTAAEWLAQGPLGLAEAGSANFGAAGYSGLCTSMAAPAGLAIWALARASNSIRKCGNAALL